MAKKKKPAGKTVKKKQPAGIVLTDEQRKARRARSIAIALSPWALVVLFYVVTLVKGPGELQRPL